MSDRDRVLITCQHVWAADGVIPQLELMGVDVDMPRFEGQQMNEDDLLPIIDRYAGMLAGDDQLTRRVLERGTKLRVISKWGIGIDAIDVDAASELGIKVLNTPGVFREELADYAMGYLHMLARRQHEVNQMVKAGTWHKVKGTSLAGRTLGIVGLGSSGRALARRGTAASMRVLGFDVVEVPTDSNYERRDLEGLLAESDAVSLHVPATHETRHLIDESALARMKPGAWLINTSRGSLVDEKALVEALREGRIGGAALDVFEEEPIASDHPFLKMDNVILGSHNGSNTREAVDRTTALAVENLIAGLGMGASR